MMLVILKIQINNYNSNIHDFILFIFIVFYMYDMFIMHE